MRTQYKCFWFCSPPTLPVPLIHLPLLSLSLSVCFSLPLSFSPSFSPSLSFPLSFSPSLSPVLSLFPVCTVNQAVDKYTTRTGLSWSVAFVLVLCNPCGVCDTDHTDPLLAQTHQHTATAYGSTPHVHRHLPSWLYLFLWTFHKQCENVSLYGWGKVWIVVLNVFWIHITALCIEFLRLGPMISSKHCLWIQSILFSKFWFSMMNIPYWLALWFNGDMAILRSILSYFSTGWKTTNHVYSSVRTSW